MDPGSMRFFSAGLMPDTPLILTSKMLPALSTAARTAICR
jgi:hypothetical protein